MKKILFLLFFVFMIPCHALTIKDFYGLSKEVDNNQTIKELKNNISSYFKVNPSNQVLYSNGLPLKNSQSLNEINNTIYLYNKKDNYIYPIKVNVTGLGTVKVIDKAKVSTNIYVNVIPQDNSHLKNMEILDFEGKKIRLDDNRFTMPFGIVTINVSFEEETKTVMNYSTVKQNTFLIPSLIFLLSIILTITIKIKSSKLLK